MKNQPSVTVEIYCDGEATTVRRGLTRERAEAILGPNHECPACGTTGVRGAYIYREVAA